MVRKIDPSNIDELNEFLEDDAYLEPYEPRTIHDWFYLCTETVSAGIDGEHFSEEDVGYEVRDVTKMPSYEGEEERKLLAKLEKRFASVSAIDSIRLEEEKGSIPGAEGCTRLILVLVTSSGEIRYRIEDWDKHWESFSIGGMF